MVKIVIENLAQKALMADDPQTALRMFQANAVDWFHSCGGKGKCTTCKMRVMSGSENLGEMTAPEKNYRSQGLLRKDERLACQAEVRGEVSVVVPNETKLAHVVYSF